ncbi:MAG: GntR family transcriptional regulator [Acidobacteriota bacterium]
MQFLLDKNRKSALVEQAREQLITALHVGTLRNGDRLPSVRQISQRNGINIKTAFSIYQRLKDEGYIELRTGSGAYVADIDNADLDQDYCRSILELIQSSLAAAGQLKIEPAQYHGLVQNFVDRSCLESVQVTVVECNEEQIHVFAHEITSRLRVRVFPVLLEQLASPDRKAEKALSRTDYFVTTDYHFKEVKKLLAGYQKKILKLRLHSSFLPELVAAARRGRVLMIVSNSDFLPQFLDNLTKLGFSPAVLDRISAVDGDDLGGVRAGLAQARSVYVSPICDPRIRRLVPARVKELKLEHMLSDESLGALEAVMLFHGRVARIG